MGWAALILEVRSAILVGRRGLGNFCSLDEVSMKDVLEEERDIVEDRSSGEDLGGSSRESRVSTLLAGVFAGRGTLSSSTIIEVELKCNGFQNSVRKSQYKRIFDAHNTTTTQNTRVGLTRTKNRGS